MYSFLLLTTLIATSEAAAQLPPGQERLVPIPQPSPQIRVADKPVSAPPPRSDAVLYWNEAALKAIAKERTPPPLAARNLAILHAAIYDAVNAVERRHRPYRVTIRPEGAVSTDAAAGIAAHRVLLELYPRLVESCDAALDATLENVPDGPAKEAGVRLGQRVAEQILSWRAEDGSRRRVRHAPSSTIGLWRPTPPGFQAAMLPQWRYVTPFAIPATRDFLPAIPPALTSAAYTEAFNEVKALGRRDGSTRTADQSLIAQFWDDGLGTSTPPGHWNRIAQTISRQRGLSLADNARLFALLNITLADAAVLCWEGKFGFNYWRPITAIHEADRDGNPDTTPDRGWDCLLTTPPFPSYPSGHSTFSGAAATALARFFGTDAIAFRISSEGRPDVVRSYAGLWAAAQEAGRSRIYGGIHYEFDNQEGLRTGRDLADFIARRYLLPVQSNDLTSQTRLISTRRRPASINLADRPRGQPRPATLGR
ncbi:MAG TPA: phosphatase PAP2 family protein [Gemmataceae bacterium]|nr:phosphatase PAP2 family protein [Gemmataceae bacterium]